MTAEQLLEITTEALEAMSDAELVVALGPALSNCAPLPGSEEEERRQKLADKEAKKAAKELAELAVPTGTEIVLAKKKLPRAKKTNNSNEKMKELFAQMTAGGVDTAKLFENLPNELKFK